MSLSLYLLFEKLKEVIEEVAALSEEQPELIPFLDSLRSSERGLIR